MARPRFGNRFVGFVTLLSFLIAAILFILSLTVEEHFGWFSLSWAGFGVAVASGSALILRGIFSKNLKPIKKFSIFLGAGLLVVALILLINEVAIEGNLVVAIILVIVTAALLLMFAVRGRGGTFAGDNQKPGYKNYHQRKAEEDARRQAEREARNNSQNPPPQQ